MPKRKRPEEKPEEQFKRFLETAKEREVDAKAAEKTFDQIAASSKAAKKKAAT